MTLSNTIFFDRHATIPFLPRIIMTAFLLGIYNILSNKNISIKYPVPYFKMTKKCFFDLPPKGSQIPLIYFGLKDTQ